VRVSASAALDVLCSGMAQTKREIFRSADVCELTQLQPYVLRSWEAEFPGLGQPAAGGSGRVYRRPDVDLVLRIKQLVFAEGLTLADLAIEDAVVDQVARTTLREVRTGLEAILQMLSRDAGRASELTLVAPVAAAGKAAQGKRRRAG
jgi:DNA-binding transcriptional MerR regulator